MAEIFDVFLSYNHDDKEAVRELVQELRDRGIRIWRDGDHLPLGQSWQTEVQKVIPTAPAAAAIIGPSGIGGWHGREIEACNSQNVQRGMPLIPILLPGAPNPATLPVFLSELTWSDLREGLAENMLDDLARRIPRRPAEAEPPLSGPGPRLHNLPFLSIGDLLKGRDQELQNLATSLASHATAITHRRAIHGLGGIGKTRLAVEYAWRYGSRYTMVLFVRVDSPESLRSGLASLARPGLLDLPERQTLSEDEVTEAVLRWLQEHPGWLLILDNVDSKDAERAVLTVLSLLHKGHVLITSRRREWPAGVRKQPLGLLPHEEATQFLLLRTEEDRTHADDDAKQASRLATVLGDLPLALEQAAAYINRNQTTFLDYLDDWERERERVLTWYDEDVMQYPDSLATTWQKTFRQLDPVAASILRLAAYLAADPIPIKMFQAGKEIVAEAVLLLCEETGEEGVDVSISDTIAALAGYSMISRQGTMLTVHRMVQEVLRTRTPEERRRNWIEKALRLVNDFSPLDPNDVRTWPVWNLLRNHTAEIIAHAEKARLSSPTDRLMNHLGQLLQAKGLYEQAESLLRRSLELVELAQRADSSDVATALGNLAHLLKATNRLSEAEPLMRRALAIDEASFGKEHPNVARDLNNLAMLLLDMNRLSEAEPLMRRALDIDEASFGKEHPKLALRLNNLAQLLKAQNRLAEAEELMRRALVIDEASLGKEHPEVARDLNNLALLLLDTNRLSEAEPLMRRALDITEASFGKDHPRVATQLNNLALLLQDTNRLVEAEPLMRRALDIDEASFGKDHPNVARDLNNLATLLQYTNRLPEAEPLMRRALAIDENSFGVDHPNVAIRLNNLAQLLQTTNHLSEAEPLMRQAVEIFEMSLVPDHPWTQGVRRNLENLLNQIAAERERSEARPDGSASEEPED